MDKEYFEKSENECGKKLIDFNDKHHLFQKIDHNGEKASIDFTGIMINGKEANIELKNRNYPSDRFDTLFIEAHKYSKLIIDWLYDQIEPLYINFMNDGTTYVFNLSKMKDKPQFTDIKGFKSKGYGGFEISERIELPITSAYKYQ